MKQIIFNTAVLAVDSVYNQPDLYREFQNCLLANSQTYKLSDWYDMLGEDADFARELEVAMTHQNHDLELAKIGKKYKLQMPAGLVLKLANS